MKKVFMFAAVAAMLVCSVACKDKKAAEAATEETTEAVADSTCCAADSTCCDAATEAVEVAE